MKDKLLQVRMSEKEIEDLKEFTEKIGFKNTSETVRESLKAFTVIKEREPEGDNFTKYNDSSSILHSINYINESFIKKVDINEYLVNPLEFMLNGFKVSEEKQNKNIELYESGMYDTLKETVLKSIYNDLLFNRDMSEEVQLLIKNIAIESLRK